MTSSESPTASPAAEGSRTSSRDGAPAASEARSGGPVGSGGSALAGSPPAGGRRAAEPGGPPALGRLKERLAGVADLRGAEAVLAWDQETYMPPGGIEARAWQLATLGRQAHELFVAPEVGELLEAAAGELAGADPDSDDARLLVVARRDWERATKIPADLVAELARAASLGQQAWRRAREASDMALFAPHLEGLLELTLQKAEALGTDDRIYDPLLDQYEPEMKTATVARIFEALQAELVPIVETIVDAGGEPEPGGPDVLQRDFDPRAQWDFGVAVMRDFGFDFERGRQDRSAHPFTTAFGIDDVRITTRIQGDYLPAGLFGTLHECGHALYEQSIDRRLARTPLADGASLGVHESQSRLWENLVGRSRAFWTHYWPRLREAFPAQLDDVDLEGFYRAINHVERTAIRVEADEVTYNLHVVLRFELENALLEGRLTVADLPEAWNAGMERLLGVVPEDDAAGVLQDIHWSMGAIGYFPTYTLGNLMSAQIYRAARQVLPDLEESIAAGRFGPLLDWLRENIYRHGRKYTALELMQRVSGAPPSPDAWLDYVREKYGELHGTPL